MSNYVSNIVVQLLILIVIVFVSIVVSHYIIDEHFYDAAPTIDIPNDFTYMPHYVKFHIYPEESGLGVTLWASDKFPPTTGVTDNKSEFTVALISTEKYNLWIPERKCSKYIVPTDDMYYVQCEVNK